MHITDGRDLSYNSLIELSGTTVSCICIFVCVYIYMCVCIYVYADMCIGLHIFKYMRIYIYSRL
jgi:hypothetical protein